MSSTGDTRRRARHPAQRRFEERQPSCCVCGGLLLPTSLAAWCWRCPSCGTWASSLPVNLDDAALDEDAREQGLASLRRRNFGLIVERLIACGAAQGARLLDVGSAHGWFVDAATSAGFVAQGVEPDVRVASRSCSNVRVGLFPDALQDGEIFDVITFNDVLEHLPDPRAAIAACRRHLSSDGLLSINIPNGQGIVYRAAVAARRRGVMTPLFERLWQVGMPSPHLWFFHPPALVELCGSEGFELTYSAGLESLSRDGLWRRAHVDRRPSALTAAGVAVAFVAAPALNGHWGSDIMHMIFRAT